jgi:hypothetical protein
MARPGQAPDGPDQFLLKAIGIVLAGMIFVFLFIQVVA